MISDDTRKEHDSFGEIEVAADALWGAQTERARRNFSLSGTRLPREFIVALALIKAAAARANAKLGLLTPEIAGSIADAALAVARGEHADQFPLDVFQTGSGTSTNMNANEVIATLAGKALGKAVHPNDHVNMCQSSNDAIPSAIHLSAMQATRDELLPALEILRKTLLDKEHAWAQVLKTGRTHLMDATPMTLGQEASGWRAQVDDAIARFVASSPRMLALAQGGTAIGTGINAHEKFATTFIEELRSVTKLPLTLAPNYFAAMGSQDAAVEFSGQLRTLAVALMKICNDLRWMGSGPLAGLAELKLPALQPGSSIMPGKVNPVIPEAVTMIAAHVIGLDAAIAIAGQSGNFQLNVMLPLIANNLLTSIELLARGARALAERCIAGAEPNVARLDEVLARNPILVTALNPVIGYERAAAIAKRAYAEGRPVFDVALEMSGLAEEELRRLLDPAALTRGGLHGGGGQG
ncbi:MAG TPA: class II fumarate hydratase [Steroidobacteraceae bacterium]|jgi:fumarate hydratase class II|nr:class II fumarate hydratase [Steroidobacteraceae bacterium]